MMNKLATVLLAVSTFGCASENDGALNISGQLADSTRVTHVIATNVETGERVVVDMKSDGQVDGRFEVSVPTGNGAWIITFADASKKGAAMRVGTLQTAGLDAFPAHVSGSLDFGTVSFSGRYAHGTMTWNRLTDALGAAEEWISDLAKKDDLSLRYSNPDIDNDGELDAIQGHAFRLDISGTYRFQSGAREAEIADIINGISQPSLRYMGTTLQASIPNEMNMATYSAKVRFDEPFYGTVFGSSTPMMEAGAMIGQPHVKFGELDGAKQVGVVAAAEREVPSGNYRFMFDNGELTFSDVKMPSAADLMAASGYAVPFLSVRTLDERCKSDCDISSIDLEWMQVTATGLVPVQAPSDAHLDVIASLGATKRAYLSTNLTNGATSQSWSEMPVAGSGLLRNELSYITTSRLCYVSVSYTSELGMKMTGQVRNPGCF